MHYNIIEYSYYAAYSIINYSHCTGMGFMARLCLPLLPTSMGFFSFIQCTGITHPVLGFFPVEFVARVAVESVCLWEEVRAGYSYVTILNQNPP